jgi:uncharacterized protein DUF4331
MAGLESRDRSRSAGHALTLVDMSHHLDSPLARQDPRLNITDQYLFDAGGETVLIMNVRTSLAGDDHPDAFHPEARYEFKVHLDGNLDEDLTYRFAFGTAEDSDQPYTVELLTGTQAGHDAASGTKIAESLTGVAATTSQGGRVWAGEALEPFYLDLSQLDAINHAIGEGEDNDLYRWLPGTAKDTFAGSTVRSIVLTVPVGAGVWRHGRHVATWSAVKLATDAGGWRQVGRTGLPMIWPLFRDKDSEAASHANETHPRDDAASYGDAIAGLVASVVRRRGTAELPEAYAASLLGRIVPDLLGYVVGTPALFGLAAFNGRRLSDNAPEIMFSLATNAGIPGGLRAGDISRSQLSFPYVVPADGR